MWTLQRLYCFDCVWFEKLRIGITEESYAIDNCILKINKEVHMSEYNESLIDNFPRHTRAKNLDHGGRNSEEEHDFCRGSSRTSRRSCPTGAFLYIWYPIVDSWSIFWEADARYTDPGDVVDVQLPSSATNPALAAGKSIPFVLQLSTKIHPYLSCHFIEAKHRGFAFITYTQALDAQDAIDNMDMNEFRGRVLKVNLAKPQRGPVQGAGNRAGTCKLQTFHFMR